MVIEAKKTCFDRETQRPTNTLRTHHPPLLNSYLHSMNAKPDCNTFAFIQTSVIDASSFTSFWWLCWHFKFELDWKTETVLDFRSIGLIQFYFPFCCRLPEDMLIAFVDFVNTSFKGFCLFNCFYCLLLLENKS